VLIWGAMIIPFLPYTLKVRTDWDPNLEIYRGTAKEIINIRGVNRRVVRFIDSNDFVSWTPQTDLLVPDINDDAIFPGYYPHFYGLSVFPIGEQYLGLLWMLVSTDLAGYYGKTHIQLVSSHDGYRWIREEGSRTAILDHGSPGAWVRVQLSVNGSAIPGYEAENCLPMSNNSQDQVVQWVNGSTLPDTPFNSSFSCSPAQSMLSPRWIKNSPEFKNSTPALIP
jgi:hypothetical protein